MSYPPLQPSLMDEIVHSVVLIDCKYADGKVGTGTGMICGFAHQPDGQRAHCVVTNRHVLDGGVTEVVITFQRARPDGFASGEGVVRHQLPLNPFTVWPHPDNDVDLCCMSVGRFGLEARARGMPVSMLNTGMDLLPTEAELAAMGPGEDVFMIGYPRGITDPFSHLPPVRRGTLATYPTLDFARRKEFLIDVQCFVGSSGSPVFHLSKRPDMEMGADGLRRPVTVLRVRLLGFLSRMHVLSGRGEVEIKPVPTVHDESQPITEVSVHIGHVIKAECLREFDREIREQFERERGTNGPAPTG